MRRAVISAAAIDLLAPLMPADAATKTAAQKKMQVRKWLQALLKANLVKGTIEGVSVHDLVRERMKRRLEASAGGLLATQREAVALLLGAFDAEAPAASYAAACLQWHVHEAQQDGLAIHMDTLLMRVLEHDDAAIRKQGALGVGVGKLRAAADACDTSGEHFEAALLMW